MKIKKSFVIKNKYRQAGQTILEVLLALGAGVAIFGAITTIVISSLNNAQFTKNQNLANSYAREGMDVIRQLRDSGWKNFELISGERCISADKTLTSVPPTAPNCEKNIGEFGRKVEIKHFIPPSSPFPGCFLDSGVKVTVSWSDGKCPSAGVNCHKIELISCFSDIDRKEGI